MHFSYIHLVGALLLAVAAGLALILSHRPRGEAFANGLVVNITPKGRATRLASEVFTQRYLLAKAGPDRSHIYLGTASDQPLGVVTDQTPTTDAAGDHSYPLPVNLLGLNEDTERMVASGAIRLDYLVAAAAGGKVRELPVSGGGTAWVVGKALTAATADGDQIEVLPCFPHLVTIAS